MKEEVIRACIERCPRLASLKSINLELVGLRNVDSVPGVKIAEVIRRDSALTMRLLRMVNSVFFGLSQEIINIEDAVIYLGVKQIRDLVISTPIMEEFERLKNPESNGVDWRNFWRHSIGTGIITRDLYSMISVSSFNETEYITGLMHDIGKAVMAFAFSEEFSLVHALHAATTLDVYGYEKEYIGWDHGQIGAYYLQLHGLPDFVVEVVAYHNSPERAIENGIMPAIVQIADAMMRTVEICGVENTDVVKEDSWMELPAWSIIFDKKDPSLIDFADLSYTLGDYLVFYVG